MEELIKIYENEILCGKKSMIEFALKDAVAYNVASAKVGTYQRIVQDLKELSEPPKLRPMSELPEGNSIVFLAVLENDAGFRFLEVLESNEYLYQGAGVDYTFTKKENFQNEHFKLIGWLYELPNPNEIKL